MNLLAVTEVLQDNSHLVLGVSDLLLLRNYLNFRNQTCYPTLPLVLLHEPGEPVIELEGALPMYSTGTDVQTVPSIVET